MERSAGFEADIQQPGRLIARVWDELFRATREPNDPWRLGTLGTVREGDCDQRIVVVRNVVPDHREIVCHVDRRSPKVRQMRDHAGIHWLFYDPTARVQLRMRGTAELAFDDWFADERWATVPPHQRTMYLAPHAPGSEFGEAKPNLPVEFLKRAPTLAESEAGRTQFCAVKTTIAEVDFYFLRTEGHLRCRFRWADGSWTHQWLAT